LLATNLASLFGSKLGLSSIYGSPKYVWIGEQSNSKTSKPTLAITHNGRQNYLKAILKPNCFLVDFNHPPSLVLKRISPSADL
jgi:hypothetical protein